MANAAPTLYDVARSAGVSISTASRVLNGSDRNPASDLRARVEFAAEQLGYRPNLTAQSVATGRSRIVALVVADIADPYFSSIAAGVSEAADARGLVVTISQCGRQSDRELALVRELHGLRPRAIVLAASRVFGDPCASELAAELRCYRDGHGAVTVGPNELGLPSVLVPNRDGARELTQSLVLRGYRRFCAVTGPVGLVASDDRLAGWRDGLINAGCELDDDGVEPAEYTRAGGYAATRALMRSGRLSAADVLLASNDVMALGALAAIRETAQARVVAVAGFDDIPGAMDTSPNLSTVRLPLERVGAQALRLALGEGSDRDEAFHAEVFVRESTPDLIQMCVGP